MKLTVIGGCGSRSLMLAKCLAQHAEDLDITDVVFMDIDKERVRVFGSMVREVFSRIAPYVQYLCTTNEKEAVMEADFVITTIRAGKEESRIIDERVALKNGVIGQETTGVGGFAMALRSIPTLTYYCRLIGEYSNPNVMVFNFTNPAGLVTQALRNQGYSFVYGICDAPSGFLRQVAALYDLEYSDLKVQLIGLNHLSYFTSVKKDGREILSEILKDSRLYEHTDMRYFEPKLAQHIGCMLNEYLYYFYYREKALRNIQKIGETRGERIKKINDHMLKELGQYDAARDFDKMLEIWNFTVRCDICIRSAISLYSRPSHTSRRTSISLAVSSELSARPSFTLGVLSGKICSPAIVSSITSISFSGLISLYQKLSAPASLARLR